MAFTQSDVTQLERAIAGGTRSVAFDDHTVTFSSIDEMLQLRSAMRHDARIYWPPSAWMRLKAYVTRLLRRIAVGRRWRP